MRSRKERLEREIRNYTAAIGEGGHSKYILEEIAIRDKEISAITDRLLSAALDSVQSKIDDIALFVSEGIGKLTEALSEKSPLSQAGIAEPLERDSDVRHRRWGRLVLHCRGHVGFAWY